MVETTAVIGTVMVKVTKVDKIIQIVEIFPKGISHPEGTITITGATEVDTTVMGTTYL